MSRSKYREELKKKRAKPRQMLKNARFMFAYIKRFTPWYFAVNLVEAIGRSGYNVLSLLYVQFIFDAIESERSMHDILLFSTLYVAYIMIFQWLVKWRKNVYCPKTNRELHAKIQGELYAHACELDPSCYDDPEFYNDFTWAIKESDKRAVRMLSLITQIINCLLSTIGMIAVIATIDLVVGVLVIVSVALSFLIRHWINLLHYERDQEANPIYRKLGYIQRIFYLPDHAKELRQGRIADLLKRRDVETTEELTDCNRKYAKKFFWLHSASELVSTLLMDMGITVYLIVRYLTASGEVTLGGFSASINAMYRLYWEMRSLGDYFNEFSEQCMYVERVRRFIDAKPRIVGSEEAVPPLESLKLSNVSFSYREGEENALVLSDVSLEIKKGERIALVGYNGAGKTTLIKLLLRLYEPTAGEILYNGKSIREFAPTSYRQSIGAVFQDYRLFASTLAENVMGGEFEESQRETVMSALRAASFEEKVKELPQGISTCLLREFDKNGVALSGGESQKVAISRAFAHPYELMILDEPSSSLDPIAEYELNQSILQNAKGRTVIFISHRLSTTRMADCIYMMENGKIIERGSHDELMEQNGKYARMYCVQAKRYQNAEMAGDFMPNLQNCLDK